MSPRNVGARALLDPRWHWLKSAFDRLYAEIDDGANPASVSVIVEDGDELIAYTIARGVPEIDRRVITGIETLTAAAETATINVAPEPA
jgi:hypothetical protein